MSFLCGIQLSSECEREGHVPCGPLHLGWGWLSFSNIYTKKNATASNIETFTFEAEAAEYSITIQLFLKKGL